ncbi:MAG: hypothetical protein ACKVOU_09115 [Cytophagales bacterium]
MENNQAELMLALAKKLQSEKREKSSIILTLKAAGIMGEDGKFTENYSILGSAVEHSTLNNV